nr:hypothetical protein [Erwinia amylovora]CBX82663.1 hypothetical protein predicted by Glimmer/Critica [Erwinia amylovora ATCC BAA-2158]
MRVFFGTITLPRYMQLLYLPLVASALPTRQVCRAENQKRRDDES